MKHLFIMIFMLIGVFNFTHAGEMTGAGSAVMKMLKKENINIKELENSGHKVLFGELTGAGKKLNLDRVKLILTKKKVYNMAEVDHIDFKHPGQANSLIDVNHLKFGAIKVNSNEIKGMVVKK